MIIYALYPHEMFGTHRWIPVTETMARSNAAALERCTSYGYRECFGWTIETFELERAS